MSFPTIDLFLKRLEDSKLLNDEQLRSIRSTAQTFEVEFASEYAAKTLIRDGILTHWQAQVLLSKGGNFFLGNHKLLELIGRGGMGTVYKAEHTVLGRIVAIKVMSRELMANKNLVARFHKEIQAGATLDNPHVVRSIDASVIGKTHFLVMEYIDGHDLWSVMAKRKKLPPGEACEYIRQAAVGLQHAHEVGMVHRDIKPSNLIRTWDKDRPLVKIFDMGLARIVSEQTVNDEMTRTGQIMGTPEYMSPEQGWDTKKVDVRGDIYSLGCTLFRLLTGRVPFQGENPLQTLMVRCTQDAPPLRKYASELSAELEEVLGKMLAKEPSRRYQTPGEVAVALTAFAVVPTRAEVEALELAADDAPPELSDADISHEEHGFEDFIHDLKELEDHPEPTVPVAKAVLVADVVEPILPIQSVRSTTRRKSKSNNTVIASVATVGVLLVGALVWAISGNGNSTAAKNSADDSGNMITFEALPATSVDEQTMLAVQVRPVEQPSSSDGFRFSLGPSAPLGMSVDPKTGRLMWTPQEEHGPGSFHVDVECVDVANPTRKGTAQVNIQVNEVDLPLRVQPISPIKANVGETVVLDIQATDPDIPVQPIHFDMAPGSPPGSRIHPQSGRFQWTVPNGMPPGEHTIAVLVDQMATRAPTSIVFEFRIVVGDQPTSLPGESFVAEIADREIEQGKQLIVPIGFTRPVPGKKVSIQTNFGKARTAAIDEKTGKIVWTPTNSDAPGEYVFKLRFMVDNNPDLIDEKSFTVKVTSATPTPPKKDAPKTPVAKVDSRKPIPPEPDRKAAEQTLREVMEREFAQAKSNLKARAKLAGELLDKGDAGQSDHSAAMLYVFYELARTESIKGRDVRIALTAVARLARIYQADLIKLTLEVHGGFELRGTTPNDREAMVESGITAAVVATQTNRFEEAVQSLKWPEIIAGSSRDIELRKELLAATELLKKLKMEIPASPDKPPSDKTKLLKEQLGEVLARLDFVPIFERKERVTYLDHSEKQLADGGEAYWKIEHGNLNLTAPSQDMMTGVVDGYKFGERYTLRVRVSANTATGRLMLGVPSGEAFRGIEISLRPNDFLSLRHAGTNKSQSPKIIRKRNRDWDDLEIHVDGKDLRVRLNGEVVNQLSNTPATLSGRLGIDADLAGSQQFTVLRLSDMRIRPW